jgi:hypothetical protein
MDWRLRLAALFIILALFGCAQGQYAAPYSPYSQESMPERGSGDSGGGGSGGM